MLDANAADVAGASGQTAAIIDRLTLDPDRLAAIAAGVLTIADLPDPIGAVLRDFTLENGIRVRKLRVPLGVVMVVFEARPNVAVDAAALCIKSGNACILRGSRLAARTNSVLVDIVRDSLEAAASRPTPSSPSAAGTRRSTSSSPIRGRPMSSSPAAARS